MGNKSFIRKTLRNAFLKISPLLPENPLIKIFNKEFGHLESVKYQKAIDANRNELPWFTYPAIEYLDQLDLSKKELFEWGSGNSSVFFSKRAKSITSVEVNEGWYNIGLKRLGPNQTLILAKEEDYADKIKASAKNYDVIIIDGILRKQCADLAPRFLNEGGMIIYDNSERDPEVCEGLREKGFFEIDFHGMGPINFYSWTTSIFFKRLDFKPKTIQPLVPKGGMK